MLTDKFESILAVDLTMALLKTFQESQQMACQNLINLYLSEELADNIPTVLIQTLLGLLLTH